MGWSRWNNQAPIRPCPGAWFVNQLSQGHVTASLKTLQAAAALRRKSKIPKKPALLLCPPCCSPLLTLPRPLGVSAISWTDLVLSRLRHWAHLISHSSSPSLLNNVSAKTPSLLYPIVSPWFISPALSPS